MASLMSATNRTPEEVRKALDRLEAGLENKVTIPTPECDETLTSLHIYTRTIRDPSSDPLTTKRGLSIVGRYAFDNDSVSLPTSRIAARCLNNIIVLAEPMRQVFVDEKYPDKVIQRLKKGDPDDELACSNLLLFSSAQTTLDLVSSFENDGLAELINENVARHAKAEKPISGDPAQPSIATLKLLSTLAVRFKDEAHRFLPSVLPILDMLDKVTVPSEPAQLPVSLLVGCLASVPFHDKSRKGASYPVSSVDKLVDVVDLSLKAYAGKPSEMNLLTPVVALLHLAQAVDVDSPAQRRLRELVLPSEDDRTQVLGKGTTLPHRLLGFASNSTTPELRDSTLSIFFELSGRDPRKFIHNVGFGNSAGFLSTKGIEVSQEDMGADATDDVSSAPINPITGQRIDMESVVEMPEMTMEEKEREAERLFVLFERLRATGVVDIENPAARAATMPDVEEIESSDDEKK